VPEAYLPQEYLPEALRGATYYAPGPFGFEREVGKRLAWWRDLKARIEDSGEGGATSPAGDAPRTPTGTPEATTEVADGGASPHAAPATVSAHDVPRETDEPAGAAE